MYVEKLVPAVDGIAMERTPSALIHGPSTYVAEIIEQRFTATINATLCAQAQNRTQWPGGEKSSDPVFDAFYGSNVQFMEKNTAQIQAVIE
ncbi:fusarubin cluster-esterase [Emericellopsis cladophorae]|uniref:Fusarubin cluster-esterase n=1 Tax=Emericellopsis cladophorae TaxID=2686198 RepID=A0A9P9Y8I5_9HYPO|nr:fusarubin cluster-esterase [Emericellopsis cladophorae]KAI6784950.1 fusarubin cluster-esterase [Emericellopsis cladophorae]